jgi:hypothetical protein
MKGLTAINNIQKKYEDTVTDCINRFVAFAHTYPAEFATLEVEYPDLKGKLMDMDPKNGEHSKMVLKLCSAALKELGKESMDSKDKEEESDYAVRIHEFAMESTNLQVAFFKTNIAVCKRIIKETKDLIKEDNENPKLFYNNPQFKKAKQEMENIIKQNEEALILNQLSLTHMKLILHDEVMLLKNIAPHFIRHF